MVMDRSIFNHNASIYATSLYILICALMDEGVLPTLERTRAQWTATDRHLTKATEELFERRILQPMHPIEEDKPLRVNPSHRWRSTDKSFFDWENVG